jgi:hypothetical protein
MDNKTDFERELEHLKRLINRYCLENVSSTTGCILAAYTLDRLKAIERAALGRWVKVEDELPPLNVPVWVFLPSIGQPVIGGRFDKGDGWFWCLCDDEFYWDKDEHVWKADNCDGDDAVPTHWAYLITPPEMEF